MAGGGAEKVITILANYYVEKGCEVNLVLLLGPEVNYELFPLSPQIQIVDLSLKGKSYIANSFGWLLSIRRFVKTYNPDKIVSFVGRINALVLTATIGLKKQILVSERNDPRNDGRSWMMQRYCEIIYRRANAIVFQTKYAKSCFPSRLSSKSFVIPNPLDIVDIKDCDINSNLFVAVGRLQPEKNHEMLIQAMSIVRSVHPKVRCEIYGDGNLRGVLQKQITSNQLEETVFLSGVKSNVLDYVSKAKVFVLTSNYEGLPNALMEAMMLGKICVSTDYEGVEDLIENELDGIVVPRKRPDKLAAVLLDILGDKGEKYDEMGKRARIKMRKYSSPDILGQWDSVIRNLG